MMSKAYVNPPSPNYWARQTMLMLLACNSNEEKARGFIDQILLPQAYGANFRHS
jgi:hypothetical protein